MVNSLFVGYVNKPMTIGIVPKLIKVEMIMVRATIVGLPPNSEEMIRVLTAVGMEVCKTHTCKSKPVNPRPIATP